MKFKNYSFMGNNSFYLSLIHSYKHYLYDAFPYPQLDPLTCTSTHFTQSDLPYMTIIDTLDTLHVLGHDDLFVEGVRKLEYLNIFNSYYYLENWIILILMRM